MPNRSMESTQLQERLLIIGAGYVGLVTAVRWTELGCHVWLVDINEDKVTKINAGITPFFKLRFKQLLQTRL